MTVSKKKITLFVIGLTVSPHILSRAKCFSDLGHEVTVFSKIGNDAFAHRIFEIFPRAKLFRNYIASIILYFELHKKNPDIIHIHYAYSPLVWFVPLLTKIPIVVSIMGGDILFDEQGDPTIFGKKLTINLLQRSNLITSKSDYLTSYLNQLDPGLKKKTKRVIWGVDLKKFKPVVAKRLREKLSLKADDIVILSPRSLKPIYNINLIVEALPQIIDVFPNAKLLITEFESEKKYKKEIINRIAELDLKDHIIFTGKIEHDDMPKYFGIADVSITIPSSDGIPQTLLEAMACEVPNIVSNLTRYEEIVQHKVSAYFTERDSRKIAQSVLKLLKESELQNKITQNAKNIVNTEANFELEVERVETAYYDLMAHFRPERRSVKLVFKTVVLMLFYFVEILFRKVLMLRN